MNDHSPISFDLGPTRTCPKGRFCTFDPERKAIAVIRGTKSEVYEIHEFIPDREPDEKESRAFEVVKQSSGEVYHCRIGGDWHTCDCKGKTSNVSQKANERAFVTGEPVYFTQGCIHLDFLLVLLWDGHLPQTGEAK